MSVIEVFHRRAGSADQGAPTPKGRTVRRLAMASAALALSVGVLAPTAAHAIPEGKGSSVRADANPCGRQTTISKPRVRVAQFCPLWRDNVPVYDSPDRGNGARVVGTLRFAGPVTKPANWFIGDSYRSNFVLGSYSNHWWAYTLSDNNTWGWVPEVYFKGGGNNIGDATLVPCGMVLNPCTP